MFRLASIVALSAFIMTGSAQAYPELMPMTDEMALELGMTPADQVRRVKMKAPSAELLRRLQEENKVVIVVNKAAAGAGAQTMTIYENGEQVMKTKVSTGKEERVTAASGRTYVSTTPNGFFRPTKMYTDYLSYTWNAPMPNAVFFVGGIAIHATGASNYSKLGTRASGGCVRTTLEDSKKVREFVMDTGRGSAPGMYVIKKEAAGRNIITGNTVSVSAINRNSGLRTGSLVQNWDTIIIVHE
ncbi:MAG: L,D-transpeptidase [Bacteriovoracia bacterium]